jgi:hypothetical protein
MAERWPGSHWLLAHTLPRRTEARVDGPHPPSKDHHAGLGLLEIFRNLTYAEVKK